MAFLYEFYGTGNEPVINFANSGNDCTTFSGTELLDCPDIGYAPRTPGPSVLSDMFVAPISLLARKLMARQFSFPLVVQRTPKVSFVETPRSAPFVD